MQRECLHKNLKGTAPLLLRFRFRTWMRKIIHGCFGFLKKDYNLGVRRGRNFFSLFLQIIYQHLQNNCKSETFIHFIYLFMHACMPFLQVLITCYSMYSILQKWVHPLYFCKYFIIFYKYISRGGNVMIKMHDTTPEIIVNFHHKERFYE